MKAKRLPVDTGVAGWNAILPERVPGASLDENIKADFLVIGAGFAGLAAAARLIENQPKAKIILLEASTIADGPVGRNSGFMIDLPHDLASENYTGTDSDKNKIHLNRTAIDFARSLFEKYDIPQEAFHPCGRFNGAATPEGLKHTEDYTTHLRAMGEECAVLDADQMHDVTGSEYYLGGLYLPWAVMLQPALWARSLADGLIKSGVQVFENSAVVELGKSGNGWLAKTATGKVEAAKVVMAVNGHAESFGLYKRRFVHVILYASMTRALSENETQKLGGDPYWALTPADPMGSTVRRINGIGGDRIVMRNQATYAPQMEVSDSHIARSRKAHEASFKARFPNLADVEMQYSWAGRLCLSLNDAPAFGEVEDGLFLACCQNGLGAAKGTLSGMLAADWACRIESKERELLLAEGVPKKLPPEPFATIGGKATLAWRQYRAGREV